MITHLFNTTPDAYQLKNGIYSFINEENPHSGNRKYNRMYDNIVWPYHWSQRIYFLLKYGSEWNFIVVESIISTIKKAVMELIRVAKPGTKPMIADETEKLISESYKKNPFLKIYFNDSAAIGNPVFLHS